MHTTATTKTDSKTDTEQKNGNTPEYRKHLKSLVLGYSLRAHRYRIMHTVRVFPLRRTAHAQVTVARRGQRFAKRFRPGIEAVIAEPS